MSGLPVLGIEFEIQKSLSKSQVTHFSDVRVCESEKGREGERERRRGRERESGRERERERERGNKRVCV